MVGEVIASNPDETSSLVDDPARDKQQRLSRVKSDRERDLSRRPAARKRKQSMLQTPIVDKEKKKKKE